MEKRKLNDVIKKINATDRTSIEHIKKNIEGINFSEINEDLFDEWLNPLAETGYFQKKRFPAAAFVNLFKFEISKGTFKKSEEPKRADKLHPGEKEDTESFEKSTSKWMEMIYQLEAEYPSYGTKAYDKNMNLRGIFDGKGGFIYTDGTVGIDPRFRRNIGVIDTHLIDSLEALEEELNKIDPEKEYRINVSTSLAKLLYLVDYKSNNIFSQYEANELSALEVLKKMRSMKNITLYDNERYLPHLTGEVEGSQEDTV